MKKILIILNLLPVLAIAQAVLPTSWNFSSPAYTNPPNGWVYGVGTNGNFTYAFGKNDALSGRLDATGEYISINFADKPGDLSFYLSPQNAGNAWGGQFDVQESSNGTNWTTVYSITSKASTATNFNDPIITRTLNQNSRWVRFYYTNKLPGGNPNVLGGNMAVDLVTISAAPLPQLQLAIKQNNTALVNGNTYLYGNVAKTVFTVQNNGTATNLRIDSITIDGANASDFLIGAFDSITNFGGGVDTFSLYFNSLASGSRFASLKIYTTDTERNPFEVKLYAIAGNFASEPINQVPQLSISNVKTYAFDVSFSKANQAEKYILLRKQASAIIEEPIDGVTYKRGDYIGGAQVAYIGTDTALLKPNYILANTGYTFAAFAFNGYDGYENYLTANPAKASATTSGATPGNYYSTVNHLSNTFITNLQQKIKQIDTVFYSNYISTIVNSYLARDTSAGKKVVNCVYSNETFVYNEPFLWAASNNNAVLTREHTFAQSWMPTNQGGTWPDVNGREVPEFNDLHNLFPTNQLTANVKRSNNPFGVVVNATYTSPTGFGKLGTDATNKTVYEPHDSQKGDLARALFYMLVRFNGINNVVWRLPANQDINLLLQWHQQDPPSSLEIARNEYIATVQKNRNPFIDYPEWVNRINFSNMTYIPDASTPTITITAPVANANVVAGVNTVISWTSANVDSVLVEWQMAPSGPFTTIGKYLASQGAINYQFNQNATNHAVVRISSVADNNVNALSGVFKIVSSTIDIISPVTNETFNSANIWIKWTKTNVDTVSIKAYFSLNSTIFDSLTINNITLDSAMINTISLGADVHLIVIEQNVTKNTFSLSFDTVSFSYSLPDGINKNNLLNDKIMVFPVPSNGEIAVDFVGNIKLNEIKVYDITGRMVKSVNQHKFSLISKGIYLLHIHTDKGIATKRVVVE